MVLVRFPYSMEDSIPSPVRDLTENKEIMELSFLNTILQIYPTWLFALQIYYLRQIDDKITCTKSNEIYVPFNLYKSYQTCTNQKKRKPCKYKDFGDF